MSAIVEVVIYARDHNGKKTNRCLSLKTNQYEWLAKRVSTECTKGVKKEKRSAAIEDFFTDSNPQV